VAAAPASATEMSASWSWAVVRLMLAMVRWTCERNDGDLDRNLYVELGLLPIGPEEVDRRFR
jgi:hypothetical protein